MARFPVVLILTAGSEASDSIFKQMERLKGGDATSQLITHVQARPLRPPERVFLLPRARVWTCCVVDPTGRQYTSRAA
eukprot:3838104-Prymnesium_polylepis.1